MNFVRIVDFMNNWTFRFWELSNLLQIPHVLEDYTLIYYVYWGLLAWHVVGLHWLHFSNICWKIN
jgi:hypothetical protein